MMGDGFCNNWDFRSCQRTPSPFRRGVVAAYALEFGAARDGDNRFQQLSAFRATRDAFHNRHSYFSLLTRNWNVCSIRVLKFSKAIEAADAARYSCKWSKLMLAG
jgi:hypothetical protein